MFNADGGISEVVFCHLHNMSDVHSQHSRSAIVHRLAGILIPSRVDPEAV
jgi:hypothetical protein